MSQKRVGRLQLASDEAADQQHPAPQGRGPEDTYHLPQSDVAPRVAVHAAQPQHEIFERNHVGCDQQEPADHLGRRRPIEPK